MKQLIQKDWRKICSYILIIIGIIFILYGRRNFDATYIE
ncbi:hypothetical protein BTJ45_04596 [Bacillus mycoides]|nr:hypothetical protein BTJ45_04596 [Bacillus mycoides]